jgi:glycerol-3-phosphate dehydrogenase (NAD(P)+)
MGERVTILGNGAMATVCSLLLRHGGHDVTMWGAFPEAIASLQHNREQVRLLPGIRVPDEVRLTSRDDDAFADATLVLVAIPTQHLRSVCRRLLPHWPPDLPIVSATKGIELTTLERPSEILLEALRPAAAVAALSGPNIAGEIARGLPATAVIASADDELARRGQLAFSTPSFRVYTNRDVVGVELAGAIKNVIALAAGMLDGLGAGDNAKAALVTRGLVEMTRLGVALGASAETFAGLAGLGDLVTTCVSPHGRNRTVGERIGRGEAVPAVLGSLVSVAEGVPTTQAAMQLAARAGVAMPITTQVNAVLFEQKDVRLALADLMTREPKPERGH